MQNTGVYQTPESTYYVLLGLDAALLLKLKKMDALSVDTFSLEVELEF